MEFRPCIDIHDGKVKQIVGGSINESASGGPKENFVSECDAAFYAGLYRNMNIKGGHVILLNKPGTEEYELTRAEALSALKEYPGGLQVGGGINEENASEFIEAGASHVIVTSYVFRDGIIDMPRLERLRDTVGRNHLVLDLSCRKRDDRYYIVTDRWQNFTEHQLNPAFLQSLENYCDEFLIHAVDVEGKQSGVDIDIIRLLAIYKGAALGCGPKRGNEITYAGGIHTYEDLNLIAETTDRRVNVTIGSALSLFGGEMDINKVMEYIG